MSLPVTLAEVEAAAAAIADAIVTTPTSPSRTLAELTGARGVWLKLENLQFTASFKERGARNFLLWLPPRAERGVVAASAGNHAQGVAYHARALGIPATIVMPVDTPFTKIANTEHHGARVVLEGEGFAGALAAAQRITVELGAYIRPRVRRSAHHRRTRNRRVGDPARRARRRRHRRSRRRRWFDRRYRDRREEPARRRRGHRRSGRVVRRHAARARPSSRADGRLDDRRRHRGHGAGCAHTRDHRASSSTTCWSCPKRGSKKRRLVLEIEKTVLEGAGAAGLAALLEHRDRFAGRNVAVICSGATSTCGSCRR